MNKNELIEAIAAEADQPKAAVGAVLDAFESVVVSQVAKGEKIALSGFLSFEKGHRSERTGRNPATGATITVPAADVPKVKAGKKFKDAVAG